MNEKENRITEQIELLTELMKVTSGVKENITSDYTLASLKKEEKEYIKENYENGEYAKEIIKRFATKGYKYEFDDTKGEWLRNKDNSMRKIEIDEISKAKINKMSERIFEVFMVSSHMITVLSRNKTENFLVKLLGKDKTIEEEQPAAFSQGDKSILQKIKDKISNKEDKDED